MAKRTSSGPEVLLGLLTIEPMSGYDLGQVIRDSVHHFWSESYGQIYPNLKQLAFGGYITGKKEKQNGKPDRQIYSITPRGRERLAHWLQVEPQPEVARNELLLKMFFGSKASPATIRRYVEQMIQDESAALHKFDAIGKQIAAQPQYPDTPYWQMVLRFGQMELAAHLRWAEKSLAAIHKLERKQAAPPRKEKRHAGK